MIIKDMVLPLLKKDISNEELENIVYGIVNLLSENLDMCFYTNEIEEVIECLKK